MFRCQPEMTVQVETIPIRRHGQAPSPFRERAGERGRSQPKARKPPGRARMLFVGASLLANRMAPYLFASKLAPTKSHKAIRPQANTATDFTCAHTPSPTRNPSCSQE